MESIRSSRTKLERGDLHWISGRGLNPKTKQLAEKSVLVIGDGSVGSFVIENLIRSGVVNVTILDYDKLSWSNIGRHSLGASSIDKSKVNETSKRIKRDFPHSNIKCY